MSVTEEELAKLMAYNSPSDNNTPTGSYNRVAQPDSTGNAITEEELAKLMAYGEPEQGINTETVEPERTQENTGVYETLQNRLSPVADEIMAPAYEPGTGFPLNVTQTIGKGGAILGEGLAAIGGLSDDITAGLLKLGGKALSAITPDAIERPVVDTAKRLGVSAIRGISSIPLPSGDTIGEAVRETSGAIGRGLEDMTQEERDAMKSVARWSNISAVPFVGAGARTASGTLQGMVDDYSGPIKKGIARHASLNPEAIEIAAKNMDELKPLARNLDDQLTETASGVTKKIKDINLQTTEGSYNKLQEISDVLDTKIDDIRDASTRSMATAQSSLGESVSGVLPSADRGANIEDALKRAKRSAGERFGSMEDEYLRASGVGGSPVAMRGEINQVQSNIDEILKDAGYDGNKFRMVERFGNSPVMEADISDALKFKKLAGEAKTTDDLINQLRSIRGLAGKQTPDGRFYNSKLMAKIDGAYQDAIETQLRNGGVDDGLVDLWRENNALYRRAIETINGTKKKLGINTVRSDGYTARIKNIGTENLFDFKRAASEDPVLAPVWEEIRQGYFESVVHAATNADGTINASKLKKSFADMDKNSPMLREVLFGTDRMKSVDNAIENVLSAQGSMSGVRSEIQSARGLARESQRNVKQFAKKSQFGGPIGEDVTTAKTRLRGVLPSDPTMKSEETLRTLEIIDAFYGTDYVNTAKKLSTINQLGISPKGTLAKTPMGPKTGNRLFGMVMGGMVGNSLRPIPVIGKPLSILATAIGSASQSPAGAVAMYKLIEKNADMAKRLPEARRAFGIGASRFLGVSSLRGLESYREGIDDEKQETD